MSKITLTILALPLCLTLACDKGKADKKSDDKADKKGDDKSADKAEPEKPAEPKKPEVKMVEHDLSSAGADWAGWVAQGPEGAKVMSDLGKAARIAADGHDAFDLAWKPAKTELAELKANVQKGADASEGKMKVTFTSDTPELLEWESEGYGSTRYNFAMNMKVGDVEVTCRTNSMIGLGSKEDLAAHKAACATLAKKEG